MQRRSEIQHLVAQLQTLESPEDQAPRAQCTQMFTSLLKNAERMKRLPKMEESQRPVLFRSAESNLSGYAEILGPEHPAVRTYERILELTREELCEPYKKADSMAKLFRGSMLVIGTIAVTLLCVLAYTMVVLKH